jgi:hypothetical protein
VKFTETVTQHCELQTGNPPYQSPKTMRLRHQNRPMFKSSSRAPHIAGCGQAAPIRIKDICLAYEPYGLVYIPILQPTLQIPFDALIVRLLRLFWRWLGCQETRIERARRDGCQGVLQRCRLYCLHQKHSPNKSQNQVLKHMEEHKTFCGELRHDDGLCIPALTTRYDTAICTSSMCSNHPSAESHLLPLGATTFQSEEIV